jgi:biotin transport system substrate-specific component
MGVVRGVVFSALFAAMLAVLSFVRIHLPFTPVPIVLENIVPMLAGAVLGAWYGGFSMLLVLVLTAIGVPILGGYGGIGVILGPTGGFVVSWVFSAFLTGWFVSRVKGKGVLPIVLIPAVVIVFGALFPYVIGVPWLAVVTKMSLAKAMVNGCYPFLLGDILKAIVASIVAVAVRLAMPAGLAGSGNRGVIALEK